MELWTAFLLGLVGSLHCAGMCGPLALALPQTGQGRTALFSGRLAYNVGRIVTYAGIGFVFGLVGKTFLLAGIQRWLSISLGVVLLVGLFASRKLALWRPVASLVERVKAAMSSRLRQRSIQALLILGLLNGFLPCGLVYVAAAAATATGNIFGGAFYMLAFGAGTIPVMLLMSLSGRMVPFSLRLKLLRAVPVAVFLLALLLILRGLELGIPHLSPIISTDKPSCCHAAIKL